MRGQVTEFANRWREGDADAGNRLFRHLAADLRMIAQARLHTEKSRSLSAGDLVNEAVLRLGRLETIEWASRPHILAMASRTMRQFLIDHSRRANSQKRAHERVTLMSGMSAQEPPLDILLLDQALRELGEVDARRAAIVEMRYFGGMTIAEIAVALDSSPSSVKRHWISARAWLQDRLTD